MFIYFYANSCYRWAQTRLETYTTICIEEQVLADLFADVMRCTRKSLVRFSSRQICESTTIMHQVTRTPSEWLNTVRIFLILPLYLESGRTSTLSNTPSSFTMCVTVLSVNMLLFPGGVGWLEQGMSRQHQKYAAILEVHVSACTKTAHHHSIRNYLERIAKLRSWRSEFGRYVCVRVFSYFWHGENER